MNREQAQRVIELRDRVVVTTEKRALQVADKLAGWMEGGIVTIQRRKDEATGTDEWLVGAKDAKLAAVEVDEGVRAAEEAVAPREIGSPAGMILSLALGAEAKLTEEILRDVEEAKAEEVGAK